MASSRRTDEEVSPSKVVHFRNLPEHCSFEDIVNLCSPFGKVVSILCNVGPNKSQGFAEFGDINEAISMVSKFTSSSRPAKLYGRKIYVQFSDRPEIVVRKFTKGNVLLVTFPDLKAGDLSIDAIRLVFSEYGFVQKISTFEKRAGFQALVQFADNKTASNAKEALNGKSIPRYLLPGHISACNFSITYSGHRNLNIRFQSNRSRDYTNSRLPVNQATIGLAVQPIPRPTDNRVLLASFENMLHDLTLDVLHGVFSEIGPVHKIYIFKKNGRTHALIQYHDVATATAAKETLEGHCIYDGGYCKIHLSYSRHADICVKPFGESSRDYAMPEHSVSVPQVPATAWQNPPAAASMNPSSGVHAYAYGYMSAPATYPDPVYGYPLGQSHPMIPSEGYIEIPAHGVPAFPPQMQAGFVGFIPAAVQPYYYGY